MRQGGHISEPVESLINDLGFQFLKFGTGSSVSARLAVVLVPYPESFRSGFDGALDIIRKLHT